MSQTLKIDKYRVHFANKEETLRIKKEVFSQHTYYLELFNPLPYIIDAGAHIGLTTLYFKKQFPGASIVAVEPNPANFKLLEENIWENGLENVEAINAALTGSGGEVTLHRDSDNSWLSTSSVHQGAWNGEQTTSQITVPAIQLSSLITRHVDLLKLDIEGAEQEVLVEAREQLPLVKNILMEFHPRDDQSLEVIEELLTETGFTVTYSKNGSRIKRHQAKGLVLVEATRET